MKYTLVCAVWLLLAVQCAICKPADQDQTRSALVKALQQRLFQAIHSASAKRGAELAEAKKNTEARIESSAKHYRDAYEDIFGHSQGDVSDYFEELCGVNVAQAAEDNDAPVKPSELAGESGKLKAYLDGLESTMDPHMAIVSEIEAFLQGADLSDEADAEEAFNLYEKLGTEFLSNGLAEEGVCDFAELVTLLFRMIEHGASDFSKHDYCYGTAKTLYTYWYEKGESVDAIAEDMLMTDFEMVHKLGGTLQEDIKCILKQVNDLRRVLDDLEKLDSDKTETEAWIITVGVTNLVQHIVMEYKTLEEAVWNTFSLLEAVGTTLEQWFPEDGTKKVEQQAVETDKKTEDANEMQRLLLQAFQRMLDQHRRRK